MTAAYVVKREHAFVRLYGEEMGQRTDRAIVAWRTRPQREGEFRRDLLAQLDAACLEARP